jgi:HD-GYP domain-containing protein (c-di-GMP phosphodiesterase class II)
MIKEPHVNLFDLVMCLSDAIDLISPVTVNHHKQVAYIASHIAKKMGLSREEQNDLILASILHDVGMFSLEDRLDSIHFIFEETSTHPELGYLLLNTFQPFAEAANIVRFHHVYWSDRNKPKFTNKDIPLGSYILHLADRIAVLINKQEQILEQVPEIGKKINEHSGQMFMPELIKIFDNLSQKEYFWFDLISPLSRPTLYRRLNLIDQELDLNGLLAFGKFVCHGIDFKSRFTATHSSGLAAVAEALAELAGFSDKECRMMRAAGYFHDLGKLAVPKEILEKPGKLTGLEFNIMRTHAYHTYCILETTESLDLINMWASLHHERIDGTGYPFHYTGRDLPLGSRIMAIADVFTAITEDRPYRKSLDAEATLTILKDMADNMAIDAKIVTLLATNLMEIDSIRITAQRTALEEYQQILK